MHVLFKPVNQGDGGNRKIGHHFAIEYGFDFVALVHGNGQYAPECLPELVQPLADGGADAALKKAPFHLSTNVFPSIPGTSSSS